MGWDARGREHVGGDRTGGGETVWNATGCFVMERTGTGRDGMGRNRTERDRMGRDGTEWDGKERD